MSSSPFASFDLSTLVFTIGDGTPMIDETGNFSASSTQLEVTAYLQPSARQGSTIAVPGEMLNQQYMKGRFVDPFRRPVELLPGMRAQATIGGQMGIFELELSPVTGIDALIAQSLGDPIAGIFRVTSNRGNFS
jgi:hypothetical protein